MTKAQKGIITENTKLLEHLYSIHLEGGYEFYREDLREALLLSICSMKALKNSLERSGNDWNIIDLNEN